MVLTTHPILVPGLRVGRDMTLPQVCAFLTRNVTTLPLPNLSGATQTSKMELAVFYEVSVSMYELIQHHIPEALKLQHHCYENKFCLLEAHVC